MLVAQRAPHGRRRQGVQSVQRVQGVQPGLRRAAGGGQFEQSALRTAVASLDQQPLGRLAPPAVGTGQRVRQIGRRSRRQIEPARRPRPVGDDLPNPAPIGAGDQRIDVHLLQVSRDRRIVLDDRPIHIHHVQRSVRPRGQIHRAKPLLGRGKELRGFVGRGPPRAVGHAVRVEHTAMDQVLGIVDAEMIAVKLGRKRVGSIDGLPAGCRKEPVGGRFGRTVEFHPRRVLTSRQTPWIRLAGRKDSGRMPVGGDIQHQMGRRIVRVAGQVVISQRRNQQGVLLVADQEAVAPIVERQPESAGTAADRLQRAAVRLETKASGGNLDFRRQVRAADRAAAVDAVGRINPIVHAPSRIVDPRPHVIQPKAGEQRLLHFGSSVAVAVRQEQNVRRAQSDDPLSSRHDAIARRQAVCPHVAAVHPAIAVGVLQQFDRSILLLLCAADRLGIGRNAPHGRIQNARLVQLPNVQITFEVITVDLGHENPPAGVKGHRHRIRDMRFGRDQLDPES